MAATAKRRTAEPWVPASRALPVLRTAVQECRGCHLYKHATQAVFGAGPKKARLMLVGEIPGDQEDKQGRVFVGPAGRMLDRALEEVGIARRAVFITNAVKHFKYKERGKRRLHDKPNAGEIQACRPWLIAEFEAVKPRMLVALGATAAKALFGASFGVMRERGKVFESEWAEWSMATVHPSSLLRAPDKAARDKAWKDFLADFRVVGKAYQRLGNGT